MENQESNVDLSSATENYLNNLDNEQSGAELEGGQEQSQQANSKQTSEQSAIELDKIEKFKFKGKDYTTKDLEKFESLQSDYTKKSQSYAQAQKFAENVHADLAKVKANPSLAEQFKQIYPKHYHSLVDLIKAQEAKKVDDEENHPVDPKYMDELNGIKSKLSQWEEDKYQAQYEANQQQLIAIDTEMAKKYPLSDKGNQEFQTELAYARIQGLIDSGKLALNKKDAEEKGVPVLEKEHWDMVYKEIHGKFGKLTKIEQKNVFNQVKKANLQGSGVTKGGSPPAQAPKKVGLSEATDVLLEDLANGNFKIG